VKCVSCFDGFTLSGQDCIRAAANAPAFTLPQVPRTDPPTTTESPTEEPTTKALDGGAGFAPPVEETTIEATDAPTVAVTEKDLSGGAGLPVATDPPATCTGDYVATQSPCTCVCAEDNNALCGEPSIFGNACPTAPQCGLNSFWNSVSRKCECLAGFNEPVGFKSGDHCSGSLGVSMSIGLVLAMVVKYLL